MWKEGRGWTRTSMYKLRVCVQKGTACWQVLPGGLNLDPDGRNLFPSAVVKHTREHYVPQKHSGCVLSILLKTFERALLSLLPGVLFIPLCF